MCEWLRPRWRWLARLMLLAIIPFLAGSATPNSIDTVKLHTGTDSQWAAACCYEGQYARYEGQYVPSDEDQFYEPPEPTSWTGWSFLFLISIVVAFLLGLFMAPSDRPSKDDVNKAISSVFDARREEAFIHEGPSILKDALTAAENEVKKKLEKDFKLR